MGKKKNSGNETNEAPVEAKEKVIRGPAINKSFVAFAAAVIEQAPSSPEAVQELYESMMAKKSGAALKWANRNNVMARMLRPEVAESLSTACTEAGISVNDFNDVITQIKTLTSKRKAKSPKDSDE